MGELINEDNIPPRRCEVCTELITVEELKVMPKLLLSRVIKHVEPSPVNNEYTLLEATLYNSTTPENPLLLRHLSPCVQLQEVLISFIALMNDCVDAVLQNRESGVIVAKSCASKGKKLINTLMLGRLLEKHDFFEEVTSIIDIISTLSSINFLSSTITTFEVNLAEKTHLVYLIFDVMQSTGA